MDVATEFGSNGVETRKKVEGFGHRASIFGRHLPAFETNGEILKAPHHLCEAKKQNK